jgi:ankyrin repeat protein
VLERVFAFLHQIRTNTAPRDRDLIVYEQELASGVTPIWYRKEHNNAWQWTPDRQNWMTVPNLTVSGGIWAGAQPAMCNKIIICALAKSDAQQQHWLPLHVAAQLGTSTVVTAVIKASGWTAEDLNRVDKDGRSALWIAASLGHVAIVRLLLAEPNIDAGQSDDAGQTPLHAAVIAKHHTVVQMLLTHCGRRLHDALRGALPACLALRDLPALVLIAILDELGSGISALTMHQKWTFVAAVKHSDAVAPNLDELRDVALPDSLGRTSVWWAVHSEDTELLEIVLRATPASVVNKADKNSVTPLQLATTNSNNSNNNNNNKVRAEDEFDIVKILKAKGNL